jgi:tRNA U34 5-carboxymethylaminomethyl modifying GTPase MnmE/TrmE
MASFPGRGLGLPSTVGDILPFFSIKLTSSQSASSHHTDTCNVVVFGETGAGKSSLINLVAGSQTALTSRDAMGCTTETNVYDVLIQNETLKVKLFDTVGQYSSPLFHDRY